MINYHAKEPEQYLFYLILSRYRMLSALKRIMKLNSVSRPPVTPEKPGSIGSGPSSMNEYWE